MAKKRNNPKAKEYLYNRTKIIPDDCFMIDEVMYIKVSNGKGNNYMRVKITPTYSSDNVTSDTSNLEKTDEGTEIKSVKKVTREGIERTVYEGYCDGIPTKWVTIGEWDFKITLRACNGEMLYTDSHGNEMLVFEDDEDGWYKW